MITFILWITGSFDVIAEVYEFIFGWMPDPFGPALCALFCIGSLFGLVKLISFILDLIPFW